MNNIEPKQLIDENDTSTLLQELNEMAQRIRKIMEQLRELKIAAVEETLELSLLCDPSLRIQVAEVAEKSQLTSDHIQNAMTEDFMSKLDLSMTDKIEDSSNMDIN